MSTYVWMRILESAPYRYDLGIRLLSLGSARRLYRRTAAAALAGKTAPRVLEIGCGTGNLTKELVARGAKVCAIDQNPEMLAQARGKLPEEESAASFLEMAAVEITDRFPAASFDAVAASLVLSEMSEAEQAYVLQAVAKLLRPGGRLVVADEVRAPKAWQRLLHGFLRWPLAAFTYAITQTGTTPVRALSDKVARAGLQVVSEEHMGQGSICLLVASRREKDVDR